MKMYINLQYKNPPTDFLYINLQYKLKLVAIATLLTTLCACQLQKW